MPQAAKCHRNHQTPKSRSLRMPPPLSNLHYHATEYSACPRNSSSDEFNSVQASFGEGDTIGCDTALTICCSIIRDLPQCGRRRKHGNSIASSQLYLVIGVFRT